MKHIDQVNPYSLEGWMVTFEEKQRNYHNSFKVEGCIVNVFFKVDAINIFQASDSIG